MVTILPIDVDEDLVREGLSYAVAQRIEAAVKTLKELAAELAVGGIIEREKLAAAFAAVAQADATATPVLEYAQAFVDQWPIDEEEEDDADAR